jgi:hypothetical protein
MDIYPINLHLQLLHLSREEPHNLKIEKQDILNSTNNVNKWVTQ